MTQEYYSSQIEFNVWRDGPRCLKIKKMFDWIHDKIPDYNITEKGPAFIGTHIHFQFAIGGNTIQHKLRRKKYIVYLLLLRLYNKTFKKMLNNDKISTIEIKTIHQEIWRLISNHNINIYRDEKFFDWKLANIRRKHTNLRYYYTNWRNKPKYQPMLWANATPGKPLTFEVRMIPNMLAMNVKVLRKIVKQVQIAFNTKGSKTLNIKKDIFTERETLCMLYKDANGVLSDRPPIRNNRITLAEFNKSTLAW